MQFKMNLFLCVCLILCFFGMYVDAKRTKGKSGPYEARLIACHKCDKPKPPYHKENKNITLELYNTSSKTQLIRINASFVSGYRDIMAKVKEYVWVNGRWKLNVVHNSDRCNGFLGILFHVIRLKYDPEHCSLLPGQYIINNADPNALRHAVRSTSEYGRELSKIEIYTKNGTLFCYEFEILVVPA